MTAAVLAGTDLAAAIRIRIESEARELAAAGTFAKLAVVIATDDEATAWYVRSIERTAQKVGVSCDLVDLGDAATEVQLADCLRRLSSDPSVHGIILQTPLPNGVSGERLTQLIDASKDVDGANPASLGRLVTGQETYAPATAEAVVALLDHHGVELSGKHAVVVGRSTVVGKPVAHLLLDRDATVTICHSKTRLLAAHTLLADVLVVAVGRAEFVDSRHVRAGTYVIDVGTNVDSEGALVGDVSAGPVSEIAGGLSPVPGGVGPVTAMLILAHTVASAQRAHRG